MGESSCGYSYFVGSGEKLGVEFEAEGEEAGLAFVVNMNRQQIIFNMYKSALTGKS